MRRMKECSMHSVEIEATVPFSSHTTNQGQKQQQQKHQHKITFTIQVSGNGKILTFFVIAHWGDRTKNMLFFMLFSLNLSSSFHSVASYGVECVIRYFFVHNFFGPQFGFAFDFDATSSFTRKSKWTLWYMLEIYYNTIHTFKAHNAINIDAMRYRERQAILNVLVLVFRLDYRRYVVKRVRLLLWTKTYSKYFVTELCVRWLINLKW